jgi:threonine aldolase
MTDFEGRNFASDNVEGSSPEVMAALEAANAGQARPYGGDEITARVERRLADLFERDCAVLLVASGTAANALGLAALTPPWGAVLCHRDAHILNDECGAPEFYTGGAKLIPLGGAWSKLEPDELGREAVRGRGDVHVQQNAAVSVTQATEGGTVYTLTELVALGEVCREQRLRLHMDGARFANALVALGCTPAEMTWRAGVDVLSFGATKNGAPGVEAIVSFDTTLARELHLRRKRAGHLASKMRYLAAQMDAYLADDLWLRNARHANAMAARLRTGLASIPGVNADGPYDANMLFVRLPAVVIRGLLEQGYAFYPDRRDPAAVRLVTSFATSTEAVDGFIASARRLATPAR